MMRYLRLLGVEVRLSIAMGAQYRWNFAFDGAVAILWTALGLVPLWVAFHARPAVEGWTFDSALLVIGWFTLLRGVLDGAVNPSLIQVVTHIREGTLDFVLLKPADAQFLVSTARFEPWKVVDLFAAFAIFGWAFSLMGHGPPLGGALVSVALLVCALAVLYSIWIVIVAAAFFVVKLDNLAHLFASLLDFGRWPVSIFKGVLRAVFTFVIPIAIMTTFPAQALLGTLDAKTAIASAAGSVVFAWIARRIWTTAIRRYTSASS